ncbi:hypothetical protein EYF80_024200 [Liparis tanakae]|uniref:Uncharacterized protein n=1 Tax=Liparis tanakae TaxID=230148 RepID=A0A4Z2HL05_9TELE|nr:hypothetical protein EYF80_024200 [Liparis tanakae]
MELLNRVLWLRQNLHVCGGRGNFPNVNLTNSTAERCQAEGGLLPIWRLLDWADGPQEFGFSNGINILREELSFWMSGSQAGNEMPNTEDDGRAERGANRRGAREKTRTTGPVLCHVNADFH